MSDAEIVRTAGFDALMLNRTILLGLQIFSVLTALGLGILLPTYYSFDDVVTHRLHRGTNVAELSRTTISNLPPGHAILWLPTLATYLVVGYVCWVLLVHCQSYAELRMAYMLCLDAAGAQPYQERKPRLTPRPAPPGATGGLGASLLPPSAAGSTASLSSLLHGVPSHDRFGRGHWVGGDPGAHALNGHVAAPQPSHPQGQTQRQGQDNVQGQQQQHLLQQQSHAGSAAPAAPSRLRASHSAASLDTTAAPSSGPVRLPGTSSGGGALARTSYNAAAPAALATGLSPLAVQAGSAEVLLGPHGDVALGRPGVAAPWGALGPAPGLALGPESPHAAAAAVLLRLRQRLQLVAPWLRHVVVGAAERAARHKAADNLLAWVNPLRMLSKDREDWARQQLAMDSDPDPTLPPVPSGHPPPATAAHAGLLVASEDMLMALTGRAGDAAGDLAPASGRSTSGGGGGSAASQLQWSESVVELADSLGIRLRRAGCGGSAAAVRQGGGASGGTVGGGGGGLAGGAEMGQAAGPGGCAARAPSADSGGGGNQDEEEEFVMVNLDDEEGMACAGRPDARDAPGAGSVVPKVHSGTPGRDGSDAEPEAPAVYRYWAPEAEQRCFARTLRRRQRRRAAAAENAEVHATLLETHASSNVLAEAPSEPQAQASGGHGPEAYSVVTEGPKGAAGVSPGGWRSARCGSTGSAPAGGAPPRGVPFHEADSDGDGDADRPWTGLGPHPLGQHQQQQQPLVVGRGNARLRQLMKVRHGGRSHLVNAHHYAVLVRDVVLRPVERFNMFGMPVLRSSEELHRSSGDPRDTTGARDVESGGGGGEGGGTAARGGGRHRRSDGSGGSGGDAEPKGRRGLSRSASGGGGSGDLEDRDCEYDPLLTAEGGDQAAEDSGGGGGGDGDEVLRRRRRRPIWHPASDLPLRDRAVHRMRELRQQHRPVGEQHAAQRHQEGLHSFSDQPDGPSLCAGESPAVAGPAGTSGAVELTHRRACRPSLPTLGAGSPQRGEVSRGSNSIGKEEEEVVAEGSVLLGPFASPTGRLAGEAAAAAASDGARIVGERAQQLSPPPTDPASHRPREGQSAGNSTPPSATREAGVPPARRQCPPLPGFSPMATQGTPAASALGEFPATADKRCSLGAIGSVAEAPRAAAAAAAAAVTDGCSTCVGPAPAPPPCMAVPYDDSEEAAAVAAFYTQLFPDSFQRLVPVCNHRVVDELLFQWTAAMGHLAGALLAAHVAVRSGAYASTPASAATATTTASATSKLLAKHRHASTAATPVLPPPLAPGGMAAKIVPAPAPASVLVSAVSPTGSGPSGHHPLPLPVPPELPSLGSAHASAIRRAAAAVARLQERIAVERARALHTPTRRAYVALFSSQRDAAAAAQCSPLAPPSRAQPLHFRACAAPPPDSLYWPALWTLPASRAVRLLASAPLLLVLIFPIGALTGALANLPVAVCGGAPQLNRLYWPWFCRHADGHGRPQGAYARLAKSLLTGVLPPLLSLGWNAWVLPMALYLLSAIQSRSVSLPGMDRQMSRWFFWWSLLNHFLGAVVGGGVFQQLGAYLQDPGKLLLRIGTALPTASNFFMHYTLTKGLYSNWLRILWPHLGCMAGATLRGVAGAALPRSWQDVFLIHSPPGYRFSSFYNGICQVLMVGLAYVVTAPLIAPIALIFFVTAYVTWRYATVYIYERQYESGGAMFPVVFDHMVGYLLVAELFTGAVLLTNGAWLQAALLWASLTPALVAFRRLCVARYLQPLEHPPLSLAMAAPPAGVDAAVYLPPALREGAAGWYPESGKVWEQYGIPKYVI